MIEEKIKLGEDELFYVFAMNWKYAEELAKKHNIPYKKIRYIDFPWRLDDCDGLGNIIYIDPSGYRQNTYQQVLLKAIQRGFTLKFLK